MKRLMEEYDNYALSISVTTRDPRPGEEDGVSYFFRTEEEFDRMVEEDDHWTPETAETAKTPRFSGAANANNFTRNSTLWLKDASYIRLKNVQIGYTFKGEWMKKIHLKNMRIYASGENLLTFDHLKIADPEATDDKQFQYPLQMIFNIGLNLNF